MSPMDVFIAEGNLEIYLSHLHASWNPEQRESLLRLLAEQLGQMAFAREHLENAQRRVTDGRDRVSRQRQLVATLEPDARQAAVAAFMLQTLEQTQTLLERHLRRLQQDQASR